MKDIERSRDYIGADEDDDDILGGNKRLRYCSIIPINFSPKEKFKMCTLSGIESADIK